jgi:hypothetical protein
MLKIKAIDELTCPILLCDFCQERITDAKLALVRFKTDVYSSEGGTEILFTHKGDCDKSLKLQSDEWTELTVFLLQIASNVGFPPREMAVEEGRRKEMGLD